MRRSVVIAHMSIRIGATGGSLRRINPASATIVCQDTYTGIRGSKEIEVKTGIVIRPADTGYLVSGGKPALSAWNMPAESRVDVDWSLAPGSEEYASID